MVERLRDISLADDRVEHRLDGYRFVKARYAPERVLAPHAHDRTNITLVLSGAFEECVGGRRLRPGALHYVVKPAGAVHSNRYGARAVRSFMIEVHPGREREIGLARGCEGAWSVGGPACAGLTALLERVGHDASIDEAEVAERLQEVVDRSRAEGERARSDERRRAARVMAGLGAELRRAAGRIPSSAEIARALGLHPVYLARVVRAATGRSLELRRAFAVREAADRLAGSERAPSEIALEVGFADQSHLSRAFRAELGTTPGRFRAACR